jgi:MOSC domain-containing protein YiiM
MPGRIESIQVSRGGVPKTGVFEAMISTLGVGGDRQAQRLFHGGPDRAVVLYSLEVIRALQHEGHPISPGSTGENLTVSGLDWNELRPGVEIDAGAARLQITKYTTPCATIRHSFLNGEFERIHQKRHPGWSRVCARVLVEGLIRPGDPVTLITATAPRERGSAV